MTKKRINSPETKNEEYDLAMQLMTIPRFCGLLQSDGHFSVIYDKEKVPFFEKYPLSLKKNVIRFQTFRTVLGELPLNYQNKERVKEIIREIYDKDLYERDKPLEVFLDIVERDYH